MDSAAALSNPNGLTCQVSSKIIYRRLTGGVSSSLVAVRAPLQSVIAVSTLIIFLNHYDMGQIFSILGGLKGGGAGVLVSAFPDVKIPTQSLCEWAFPKFESYGDKVALVDDNMSITYADLLEQSKLLAAALSKKGFKKGDCVSASSDSTDIQPCEPAPFRPSFA